MDHLNLKRRDLLKLISYSPLFFLEKKSKNFGLFTNKKDAEPNFLFLVFDAFSARHLSLLGYERDTTPNLNQLSQSATIFYQHHAGGNYTTPGTASLLTGVYPWKHRALHIRGKALPHFDTQNIFKFLPTEYHTFAYTQNPLAYSLLYQFHNSIDQLIKIPELAVYADSISQSLLNPDFFIANEAELLAIKNQYDPPTSLFLSALDSFYRTYKTNRLYSAYQGYYPRGVTSCQMGEPHSPCFLLPDAIDWLQQKIYQSPQPFFGYIHLIPPHAPYNPPHPYTSHFDDDWKPHKKPEHIFSLGKNQTNLNRKRRYYDQYIEYLDSEIGRLFDFLKSNQILDNTFVFITSDHGEMFERGIIDHLTQTLFEPVIHIPLLIFSPGQKEKREIHTKTSAIDIFPTILQIMNRSIPEYCEGVPLPGLFSEQNLPERIIFAIEAKQNKQKGPLTKATFTMIKAEYKLILYRGYPETNGEDYFELFNLTEDPEELYNLYNTSASSLVSALEEELIHNIEMNN